MIPRAALRLQFHRGFTFSDAMAHVAYFAQLGISHVYASPIAVARAGSMHGYDVVDPTRVNPELGGESGLRALADRLHDAGLGIVLDIVPNHMAADPANLWWSDVLRHGRGSRHADWFDIDWDCADTELQGKVLLPVLGKSLAETIAAGELAVATDAQGRAALRYFSQVYPLADASAEGRGSLPNLLARQNYVLSSWQVAGDRINWRRFFDINELVCLRMEDAAAFDAVHALPLRLFQEGVIDGLRIDHVDGLRDPAGYCRKLRARLDDLATQNRRSRGWLVVEKILLKDERLPADWACDGTTGYDFMNDVSALQHDDAGEAPLAAAWTAISGRPGDFAPEELAARREIVARSFSAQLEACATSFQAMLSNEVPLATLGRLLAEFLAHFPIYRTYGVSSALSGEDAVVLKRVAARVSRTCLGSDRWAVAPLLEVMLAPPATPALASGWPRAIGRFQQLSAPIAARSIEDTAFYRYGRLLSRNDVGFDVECFALDSSGFHERVRSRQATHPHAMLATATHDHKRGEDVRARLAVLSEIATDWTVLLKRWVGACAPLRTIAGGRLAPSPGDIAMLIQMVVGAWPLDLHPDDVEGRSSFAARLAEWQIKALREAKIETDWASIDEAYEAAARAFTLRLVGEGALPETLSEIFALVCRIAPAGAVNGLAQCLLKLTVPGVPDFYQGTDLWDFSLVDPDNRRPVDFATRAALKDAPLTVLAAAWRDGRIKQALVRRTLALRRQAPRLFSEGLYRPLDVEGAARSSIVAFVRRVEDDWLLVIVPRLVANSLRDDDSIMLSSAAWKGTTVVLDEPPPARPLYDALGGGVVELLDRRLKADLLFGSVPLALISSVAPDRIVDPGC